MEKFGRHQNILMGLFFIGVLLVVSGCPDDEDPKTCDPVCDTNLCQECSGEECVSICTEDQFCQAGECMDNT